MLYFTAMHSHDARPLGVDGRALGNPVKKKNWVLWLKFSGCHMKVLLLPNRRLSCRIYAILCCETDSPLQQL